MIVKSTQTNIIGGWNGGISEAGVLSTQKENRKADQKIRQESFNEEL